MRTRAEINDEYTRIAAQMGDACHKRVPLEQQLNSMQNHIAQLHQKMNMLGQEPASDETPEAIAAKKMLESKPKAVPALEEHEKVDAPAGETA